MQIVFTFAQGSFYSYRTQRKTSCGFPCEDLTFQFIAVRKPCLFIQHQATQQSNYISKTAVYLLFYLFPCLWITFRDPFVNHVIKTMLCYIVDTFNVRLMNILQNKHVKWTSLYPDHHGLYCMFLCCYLIRRERCKRTVSSCEDVSSFRVISGVWNNNTIKV